MAVGMSSNTIRNYRASFRKLTTYFSADPAYRMADKALQRQHRIGQQVQQPEALEGFEAGHLVVGNAQQVLLLFMVREGMDEAPDEQCVSWRELCPG
jgi:hypothetical protein